MREATTLRRFGRFLAAGAAASLMATALALGAAGPAAAQGTTAPEAEASAEDEVNLWFRLCEEIETASPGATFCYVQRDLVTTEGALIGSLIVEQGAVVAGAERSFRILFPLVVLLRPDFQFVIDDLTPRAGIFEFCGAIG